MKEITYCFKIQTGKDAEINPYHLAEEIQAYLDSHASYYNSAKDVYETPRVIGYNVKLDEFTPTGFPKLTE